MAGKFKVKKFAEINLDDVFFDSLKEDYPGTENSTGFVTWFNRKAQEGATALVFEDAEGLGAFVAWKEEEEEILLQDACLQKNRRIKISTFQIAERYQGQRIGEGAIGLLLWQWQSSDCSEIYLTSFSKHTTLIELFERFGFSKKGINLNDEYVLMRDRDAIDFSDPYKAFPFINGNFDYAGYIIIDDHYHDTMFAYSELARTEQLQSLVANNVSNGLTKIYVGQASTQNYWIGEPILVYRRYTQGTGKRFRSCLTSYCVVTDLIQAKKYNNFQMSFEDLKRRIGNKSVFNEQELYDKYQKYQNVTIVEMLYYGFFGAGNNVNMDWLDQNGYWANQNQYPTEVHLTEDQFKTILTEGDIHVSNVVID